MDTYTLNPKRKCKCQTHTSDARWHGSQSGYQYHRCDCVPCKTCFRVKPTTFTIKCAGCLNTFESTRMRTYCKPECRPKHIHDPIAYGNIPPHERTTIARRRYVLWLAQNGICAMCHEPMEFSDATLDHDHSCCDVTAKKSCGNCDRGVLHDRCNRVLGSAQDNTKLLTQAIEYLESRGIGNGPSLE